MRRLRKRVYIAAGYNTLFYGPGRPEFNPKEMPPYEHYLKETAQETLKQIPNLTIDEGYIGSFMPGRFINQANLPSLLPFMVPELKYKQCVGIEGACATGSKTIAAAVNAILAEQADVVFAAGFEIQNTLKSVYGADVLAGAAYYREERKKGAAYFFPGIFSDRAGAYFNQFDKQLATHAMARWYEQAIINARKNPKAQEFHNDVKNLVAQALTPPDPNTFLPHLNVYDCSKISDGASSLIILSEEGLKRSGINKSEAIEIVSMGAAEADLVKPPESLTALTTTQAAVKQALEFSGLSIDDIGLFEIHDCFTISALLSIEAIGLASEGRAPEYILEGMTDVDGITPFNPSGGLIGYGHPTGATGVRQMVDLYEQLCKKAPNQINLKKPYAMMVNMGGNDKTITCFIVKAAAES